MILYWLLPFWIHHKVPKNFDLFALSLFSHYSVWSCCIFIICSKDNLNVILFSTGESLWVIFPLLLISIDFHFRILSKYYCHLFSFLSLAFISDIINSLLNIFIFNFVEFKFLFVCKIRRLPNLVKPPINSLFDIDGKEYFEVIER